MTPLRNLTTFLFLLAVLRRSTGRRKVVKLFSDCESSFFALLNLSDFNLTFFLKTTRVHVVKK